MPRALAVCVLVVLAVLGVGVRSAWAVSLSADRVSIGPTESVTLTGHGDGVDPMRYSFEMVVVHEVVDGQQTGSGASCIGGGCQASFSMPWSSNRDPKVRTFRAYDYGLGAYGFELIGTSPLVEVREVPHRFALGVRGGFVGADGLAVVSVSVDLLPPGYSMYVRQLLGASPADGVRGAAYCHQLQCTVNDGAFGPDEVSRRYDVQLIGSDGNGNYVEATSGPVTVAKLPGAGGPGSFGLGGAGGASPQVAVCSSGDPVNCATGNLFEARADLETAGFGALHVVSVYNSQAAATEGSSGALGYGWSGSYRESLEVDGGGQRAVVHDADGSTVAFEKDGQGDWRSGPQVRSSLSVRADGGWAYRLPSRRVLRFSPAGRLEADVDRNGNETTMSYDADGSLSSVSSPSGRTVSFSYDSDGQLSSAHGPGGAEVSYGYTRGELTSVTDVDGRVTSYAYDAAHELTSVTRPGSRQTTTAYDDQLRVVDQTEPDGGAFHWAWATDGVTVTDPAGARSRKTFNALGEATSIIDALGSPEQTGQSFSYDAMGDLLERIDGRGKHWSFSYDAAGNRVSASDPLGHTSHFSYDSERQVLTATAPSGRKAVMAYDADGNLTSLSQQSAGGSVQSTSTMSYRSDGLLDFATDPLGRRTDLQYSSAGELSALITPSGARTTWTRDAAGRVESVVWPRGNIAGATAADHRSSFTRDAAGRVLTQEDPLGHQTLYAYDAAGELSDITDASGHHEHIDYTPLGLPGTVHRADASTLSAAYDPDGRLTAITDALGHTTTYDRDRLGRVTAVTDALGRTTRTSYDEAGNPTGQVDAAGQPSAVSYDDAGRVSGVQYASGSPADVSVRYDEDDQVTGLSDQTGTSTREYDPLGRLSTSTDGAGASVSYDHDDAGQLTDISYPDLPGGGSGGQVHRTYSPDGQLASITDPAGGHFTFDYNADGQLTHTTFPAASGQSETRAYDAADRLASIDITKNSTSLLGFSYQRTATGQLSQQTTTGTQAGAAAGTTSYTYDTLGQLSSAGAQTYAYTAAGGLSASDTFTAGTYDAAGQLGDLTSSLGGLTSAYSPQGHRTSTSGPTAATRDYTYDQAGQLKSSQSAQGPTTSYAYDAAGLRASATTAGQSTQYAWDTESAGVALLLADKDSRYVYGPDGAAIEQLDSSTAPTYLHHDQLTSTRLLSHADGSTAGTASYTPYGTPATTGTTSPLGYAGQYTDPTGLQYDRARYYDPSTGQFLTRDPLEAQTHQPYQYAAGDPINQTDPTGQLPIPGLGDISAQNIADTAAAFGDNATGGGTSAIRQILGTDNVDYCSNAYTAGATAGTLASIIIPGDIEAAAGARIAEGAITSASKAEESGARAFVGRRGATKTFDDGATTTKYGGEFNIPRGTNVPGEVNGVQYSGHAFDQMQGRGITPTAVEDALSNAGTPGRAGTTIHHSSDNDLSVVTGRGGRVVTVGYGRFR